MNELLCVERKGFLSLGTSRLCERKARGRPANEKGPRDSSCAVGKDDCRTSYESRWSLRTPAILSMISIRPIRFGLDCKTELAECCYSFFHRTIISILQLRYNRHRREPHEFTTEVCARMFDGYNVS